jgi:hypothetical protein
MQDSPFCVGAGMAFSSMLDKIAMSLRSGGLCRLSNFLKTSFIRQAGDCLYPSGTLRARQRAAGSDIFNTFRERAFGNSFYWPQINADEIDLLNKNPKFAYQQTGFIKIKVYLHLSVAELNYRMLSS